MRNGRGHDLLRASAGGLKMPCTLRRPENSRAHHDERLGPGRSAAPDDDRLVLLPSGPDTVRGSPLRGTRSSTSHRPAAFESGDLGREFSPAGADCRYRAPLVPRLARPAKDTPSRSITPSSGCGRGRSRHARDRAPADGRPGRWGDGGEGGIRTRDGLPRTAFPVRRHSPLGDLSPDAQSSRARPGSASPSAAMGVQGEGGAEHRSARTAKCVSEERRRQRTHWAPIAVRRWRRGRDSNPRCFRTPLFESGTINHSDTSPRERIPKDAGRPGRRLDRKRVSARGRARRGAPPRPAGSR